MTESSSRSPSRGDARRAAILDAALALLAEEGYDNLSTRAVSARAKASKETLYAHFGDRRGLLAALVLQEAEATNTALRQALTQAADAAAVGPVRPVLVEALTGLVTLLTSSRSVAINRVAIAALPADPEPAEILAARGRRTTGPLFEALLRRGVQNGELVLDDPATAFEVLYGLAIRDSQIGALLGRAPAWTDDDRRARADHAVALFYRLYGASGTRPSRAQGHAGG
ncbi:TetR/AcrR family transcriptional regulator [Frankia sp. QA3]|uniref:TetR/AcrR family transcriptional regulator n=1 Tax=Frankia sp. QA3 TaxID=710111 RepID=UPI000269C743|nr:TetR/AcrR family transcriptional regulator [Frankia sp. QA3]EIV94843.1 transcriptional regulator [Frankia sp. QA3]